MPQYKKYIPPKDDDFFNFQGILVDKATAHKAELSIPDDAVNALIARRVEYEPLYRKSQSKETRTMTDVFAHRRTRKIYEKEIRAFVNSYLRYNPALTIAQRVAFGLIVPDTNPSPRPAIKDIPIVGLNNLGGGEIKAICFRETDQNRPSLHPDADAIEVRFVMIPVADKSPTDPEACTNSQVSKKAKFVILCGQKNAGKRFYGFFRWANLVTPVDSGPWSAAHSVVIA